MATDNSQLALQVHLAEFSALRQEILEIIKWRDQLAFFSLGISGALFSFALSPGKNLGPHSLNDYALYLVAPLGASIGGLWLVNAQRIQRLGSYIRDCLAPKINAILELGPRGKSCAYEAFEWESSTERLLHKWQRRLLEWVVLLSAFVFSGAMAQYAILSQLSGSLIDRIRAVENPAWFVLNCLAVLVAFVLFLGYLLYGTRHRASIRIRGA